MKLTHSRKCKRHLVVYLMVSCSTWWIKHLTCKHPQTHMHGSRKWKSGTPISWHQIISTNRNIIAVHCKKVGLKHNVSTINMTVCHLKRCRLLHYTHIQLTTSFHSSFSSILVTFLICRFLSPVVLVSIDVDPISFCSGLAYELKYNVIYLLFILNV